jgi:hypothetical protein
VHCPKVSLLPPLLLSFLELVGGRAPFRLVDVDLPALPVDAGLS